MGRMPLYFYPTIFPHQSVTSPLVASAGGGSAVHQRGPSWLLAADAQTLLGFAPPVQQRWARLGLLSFLLELWFEQWSQCLLKTKILISDIPARFWCPFCNAWPQEDFAREAERLMTSMGKTCQLDRVVDHPSWTWEASKKALWALIMGHLWNFSAGPFPASLVFLVFQIASHCVFPSLGLLLSSVFPPSHFIHGLFPSFSVTFRCSLLYPSLLPIHLFLSSPEQPFAHTAALIPGVPSNF